MVRMEVLGAVDRRRGRHYEDRVRIVEATLRAIPGLDVRLIESSCCGLSGAFGFGTATIDMSLAMAELRCCRRCASDLIVADGTSCRHQIQDGAAREALHVARVLDMALDDQALEHLALEF